MKNKHPIIYRIMLGFLLCTCSGMLSTGWAAGSSDVFYPDLSRNAPKQNTDGPTAAQTLITVEAEYRQLFHRGYERYTQKKYQQAAEMFFRFLSARTPDETGYEWAEFFFGISLHKMGYSHAAVDTLSNLVTRKPNPQIVSYILELLEQISRSTPHDRDMLVNRTLCDQSYDFIEGPVADFIHYYQGEYDWEHGLFSWGDEHFSKIRPDTFYYHKYLFKRALRAIYADRIEEAMAGLKEIITKLSDGDPLKDDARKTLARLYYENAKFSQADFLYQQIEMNIVEQAQNLLERAWTHYRMGNAERAMGLLYSFEAPSFVHSFTPEFYILKSFIYKDVCHYKSAMQVLEKFADRYGESLDNIYQRRPPQDNQAMLLVILNKPKIKRQWHFLNLLESEQASCADNPDAGLQSYLVWLYTLKRNEVEHKFSLLITDEYEKMANAMLQFEEEAHLMEYEIGIDMYQRVQDYHFSEDQTDRPETDVQKRKVIYAFQGEFWNDELDDYEVALPNKCQNAEEWDIFFK